MCGMDFEMSSEEDEDDDGDGDNDDEGEEDEEEEEADDSDDGATDSENNSVMDTVNTVQEDKGCFLPHPQTLKGSDIITLER